MTGIVINIQDHATPALRSALAQLRGLGPIKAAARGVSNSLRDHLRGLEETHPNKLGGRRLHYWSDAAKSVQNPAIHDAEHATVSINQVGIGLHVHGGDVYPVKAKALTIPVDPEAYGRGPLEFPNLKLVGPDANWHLWTLREASYTRVQFKDGRLITRGKGKPKFVEGGKVLFILVKHAHFEPMPDALPDEATLAAAAVNGADQFVQAMLAHSKN